MNLIVVKYENDQMFSGFVINLRGEHVHEWVMKDAPMIYSETRSV